DEVARKRYTDYYSTARLRRLAGLRVGTRHGDLFRALWLVMEQLGSTEDCLALGLPALNGFLFSRDAMPDLYACELANHELLAAVRSLAYTDHGPTRRTVDYKNLGSEELGSIYESLLELHPELSVESATFKLSTASGNARKISGSYYTPTSLIDCLLDSALVPVLKEARARPDAEQAILALKVCDPACGSGHFLIAAAHRIAKELAAMRTGTEEPGPAERRAALRDVVSHCLYGVDINPMAVELCKVSLWMEAIEPGKPLSFLDAHIKPGNSLLGATPALLREGIPNEAFEPIEGDDKKICSEFKKLNSKLRAGNRSLFREDREEGIWEYQGTLMNSMLQLEGMSEDTVEEIRRKETFFKKLLASGTYANALLWANAWCAAFVWKKTAEMRPPITDEELRDIGHNPHSLAAWRKEEIERLARQYQFFHWHLAFPEVFHVPLGDEQPANEQAGWSGGFDVVLGNPPWERIKIQEKEWFASRAPAIASASNAAARRKMIAALQSSPIPGERELSAAFMEDQRQATGESHFVRDSCRYPLCGRGDVNTYAIFAENMRWIVSPTGRVGCIVPSGIATDDTTKWFFREVIETHSLVSFFSFLNEAKLFSGIDHRVNYALLTMSGKETKIKAADFAFGVYTTEALKEEERHFSLSANDIALLNPNTRTCPIFRSKRDMELTKAIYQRVPVLIEEQEGMTDVNPWQLSFKRMFDMANDSGLFRTREQLTREGWKLRGNVFRKGTEQYLPLYEGKMIWHFDHRFGTYDGQTQAQANQGKLPELNEAQHVDPYHYSLPQYWVHTNDFHQTFSTSDTVLLGFRDITGASVLRTAVFSLLPSIPCGHTLPLVLFPAALTIRHSLLFLSNMAAFPFDYVARQKLGGSHMTFFILKQLPVLPPATYATSCPWHPTLTPGDWIAPRALELTYTAWDLAAFAKDCGYDGPPFRWDEERRFLLRCELDAAYFHLYGIARDDVDYIMDTFRVWREKEEKQQGEYRTKRVILEIYDEMQRAIAGGVAYRTRLEPGPADQTVAHATHKPPLVEPGDIEDAGPARQVS
ncbi:MAG TPA: N-6 DNA methylase, partial [Ktedonobacteraceae bacterium]|nr:N-6 DNA methylase [Ktedonobacteraceae bacterium]